MTTPVPSPADLPIDALKSSLLSRVGRRPILLTSTTGSGKSTRVPVWSLQAGRVLVVEPRRVACRALAHAVAGFEGWSVGEQVGYATRDGATGDAATPLRFVTPGVALRMLATGAVDHDVIILDEFHERTLQVDLLAAILRQRCPHKLVLMSATLDVDALTPWLQGDLLQAEGRQHPVEVEHLGGPLLPTRDRLPERVGAAVTRALEDTLGDVLVFLPGKAEIGACERSLRGGVDADVLSLHGGLSLKEQARVLGPAERRRVILSTNVAETSLTVPGVTAVVDSGLVRRTAYHQGRGYLTCVPIARDAAAQRAGRAGRLQPGRCYRLWASDHKLQDHTPVEVHRESLVPLLMGAAMAGEDARTLPLPTEAKAYALDDAMAQLQELGAMDEAGRLTAAGRAMGAMPVDAHFAALLHQARGTALMPFVVELVAALSVPRPLFARAVDEEDDLGGEARCDVQAHILALRSDTPERHGIDPVSLREARAQARRLREALGVDRSTGPVPRQALALAALRAWPSGAWVARRRGRRTAWANGGTECQAGRRCRVDPERDACVIGFDHRGLTTERGDREVLLTAVMPIPLAWLVQAGVGRATVEDGRFEGGELQALVSVRYARKVLDQAWVPPTGDLVAPTLVCAWLRRPKLLAPLREALELTALAHKLGMVEAPPPHGSDVQTHLRAELDGLGLRDAEEAAVLEVADLMPPALPFRVQDELERNFPTELVVGGSRWRVTYEPDKRRVVLVREDGRKGVVPPARYLPRWGGWRVFLREASNLRQIRG